MSKELATEGAARLVQRDADDPSAELRFSTERRKMSEGPDKRLLCHILGVGLVLHI